MSNLCFFRFIAVTRSGCIVYSVYCTVYTVAYYQIGWPRSLALDGRGSDSIGWQLPVWPPYADRDTHRWLRPSGICYTVRVIQTHRTDWLSSRRPLPRESPWCFYMSQLSSHLNGFQLPITRIRLLLKVLISLSALTFTNYSVIYFAAVDSAAR